MTAPRGNNNSIRISFIDTNVISIFDTFEVAFQRKTQEHMIHERIEVKKPCLTAMTMVQLSSWQTIRCKEALCMALHHPLDIRKPWLLAPSIDCSD